MCAAVAAFLGYTMVMLRLERRMTATGGPGIIAFELAGTADRANQIIESWGPAGQRAALTSLRLDFGYMLTYGVLLGMLIDRVRRRHAHPAALPWLAAPAVIADALEGVFLLKVLRQTAIEHHANRARLAALIKFGVLAVALGYVVVGWRK